MIDEYRGQHGVEPICRTLGVASSTYYAVKARERNPSQRALKDRLLLGEIRRVHKENHGVYGARKVWWQLQREGTRAARCSVERLMAKDGLKGAVRGKKRRTTIPDGQSTRAPDLVDRDFKASAPNRLWVSDFTYVPAWSGTVYVAFTIDVFSRRIVGWKADTTMKTPLVLDTLEMALWARDHHGQPVPKGLIAHSDAAGRVRDPSMDRLVQPPTTTRQLRPANARRIRANESKTDHSIKTASTIRGAVQPRPEAYPGSVPIRGLARCQQMSSGEWCMLRARDSAT